jgi:hypothetical protein
MLAKFSIPAELSNNTLLLSTQFYGKWITYYLRENIIPGELIISEKYVP